MKKIITGCIAVVSLFIGYATFTTYRTKQWLYNPATIEQTLGYTIPSNAEIIDTDANIWSLADGDNYYWTIRSASSLKPWLEDIEAHREYSTVYETWHQFNDRRTEEGFIELSADEKAALIYTFRP